MLQRMKRNATERSVRLALLNKNIDPDQILHRVEPKPTFIVEQSTTEWVYDHLDKPTRVIDVAVRAAMEWKSLRGNVSNASGIAQAFKRLLSNHAVLNGIDPSPAPVPTPNVPALATETMIIAIRPGTGDVQLFCELLEGEGFRVYVQERV